MKVSFFFSCEIWHLTHTTIDRRNRKEFILRMFKYYTYILTWLGAAAVKMHEYGKPEEESCLVTDPMSLSDEKFWIRYNMFI